MPASRAHPSVNPLPRRAGDVPRYAALVKNGGALELAVRIMELDRHVVPRGIDIRETRLRGDGGERPFLGVPLAASAVLFTAPHSGGLPPKACDHRNRNTNALGARPRPALVRQYLSAPGAPGPHRPPLPAPARR